MRIILSEISNLVFLLVPLMRMLSSILISELLLLK